MKGFDGIDTQNNGNQKDGCKSLDMYHKKSLSYARFYQTSNSYLARAKRQK